MATKENPFSSIASTRHKFPSREDKEIVKKEVISIQENSPKYKPVETAVGTGSEQQTDILNNGEKKDIPADIPDEPTIKAGPGETEQPVTSADSEEKKEVIKPAQVTEPVKKVKARRKEVSTDGEQLKEQTTTVRVSKYTNSVLKGLSSLTRKSADELIEELARKHPLFEKVKEFYDL